jgi:general secretion pathway protein A
MYLDFYGLKEYPFNITPDPRFLFFSTQHREAFDSLIYGINQRKGFIALTGEVGSGKTTLCRAVLSNLSRNTRSALVLNPSLSETQLLRAILNDFGLAVKGRGDRLSYIELLNEFLLDQARNGNNVVLIIDEAQDLLPEVLEQVRLLNNLETDQQKLMQIILAGQPELKDRLGHVTFRQLRQRIMVSYHLRPLTEEETTQYITHRLHVAGAKQDLAFESEAVNMVYKYSRGIPRLVNAICDNALLAGYVAKSLVVGVPHIKKAMDNLESVR